ncbi:hypothetical protein V8C40DRAFT_249027 [Trichoderma camerunense]
MIRMLMAWHLLAAPVLGSRIDCNAYFCSWMSRRLSVRLLVQAHAGLHRTVQSVLGRRLKEHGRLLLFLPLTCNCSAVRGQLTANGPSGYDNGSQSHAVPGSAFICQASQRV